MCSVSHSLKAIYIHIPKNAGLYVKKILENFYGFNSVSLIHENHDDFIDVYEPFHDPDLGWISIRKKGMMNYYMSSKLHDKKANITKEQWKSYFKFTFVRNPYDKIVSAWKFSVKTDKLFNFPENFSLLDFLKTKEICSNYAYTHAFITQTEHLLDTDDKLEINYVGYFESLNEELCNVLFKLGIEQITHYSYIKKGIVVNLTKRTKKSIDNYYDQETLELVNKLFEEDFKNFNYKKCENMIELKEEAAKINFTDEDFMRKNFELFERLKRENKTLY